MAGGILRVGIIMTMLEKMMLTGSRTLYCAFATASADAVVTVLVLLKSRIVPSVNFQRSVITQK